eukprot:TRINITY_DN2211_c0_g1_i1.p1 TRINITY_DN2211_c0_g1~~TRINITY_DN2211_c0_g1_i1.p1  ORF type:complete len:141 (-),score=1.91 TRINITY_DN2211_c0_g1_i1:380-802(-)
MHPLSQRNCNTRIQRSLAQNRRHSNTCYLTVRSVVYRMMHCSMPALASPHGAQQATSGIASMVQKVVGGTLELHSPARAAAPCVNWMLPPAVHESAARRKKLRSHCTNFPAHAWLMQRTRRSEAAFCVRVGAQVHGFSAP